MLNFLSIFSIAVGIFGAFSGIYVYRAETKRRCAQQATAEAKKPFVQA